MGASVALSFAAVASTPPPANAGLLDNVLTLNLGLGGQPLLKTGPASSLQDAFSGTVPGLLQGLLCPVVGGVNQIVSPIPGVGTLTNQLTSITCALNILGYAYRTTYIPATGPPVVKYTRAIAALPTPLDVDGNGTPDFTGNVAPALTLNGVTMNVSRLNGFSPSAKVSVEAVLLDPLSPNTYLGVGEDGTSAGTASSWNATVTLLGISSSTTDLGLTLGASGAPAKLGTLGEIFAGNPDSPTTVSRGNVAFSPVPSTFNTEIRLSDGRQEVIAGAPSATKVEAHVNLIKPGNQKDVDATVDQLPSSVDVVHQSSTGHETVTYAAGAAISKLSAAYHDRSGATINTAAALDATNVPSKITFDQSGGRTTVASPNGAFGSVEARYATGGGDVPPPGAGTSPYVAFHRFTSSKLTAGVRLTNLKSVSVDPSGPFSGQLVFSAPLTGVALAAQDDVSGITVNGTLSNLPLQTDVTADIPNGVVTFDGHGTGISQIALHATKASGTFFTRASRLDATIDNIPAQDTISFKQDAGKLTAAATAPIGTITLLASDGSAAPAVAGSYAWYEDTPARYRAFARISNLTGLTFSGNPLGGAIDTSAPQVLNLHGETAGITATGAIDQLPSHVGFSLTSGAGGSQVVDYAANGAINQITLDVAGLSMPFGMTNVHAEIDALPSHLTLTLPPAGGTVVLDTHGTYVGRMLAQAYGELGPKPSTPGRQLLAYDEENKQITADLHNVGGASISESASPLNLSYDIGHDPLDFLVQQPGGKYLDGTISNPQPATIFVDPSGGNVAALYQVQNHGPNFTGQGQIDQIDLTTDMAGGYLEASLQNVPAHLFMCLQPDTGTRCKPTWVPLTAAGHTVPAADLAVQLQPLDINGNVPANRLTVNGRICPDQPDPGLCSDNSHHDKRIVIDDLKFNSVEAAYGAQDDGCTVACGRAWAGFNTANTHINGRVRYYAQGDDDPTVDFDAPDPNSFLAANRLFFFIHYDLVSLDPIDVASSGSLSCGSPKPKAEIEIPGPNVDILGGTFGVCP